MEKLELKHFNDNVDKFIKKQINVPQFNIEDMNEATKNNPAWVHFGAGNLFRAYQSSLQQTLLEKGVEKTGIIVVEGFDYQIIDDVFIKNNNNSLLVTLKNDGKMEKTIISSVSEALRLDKEYEEDFNRIIDIFKKPSLQMISFTITEKGYNIHNNQGKLLDSIKNDISNPIKEASTYIGKITYLLYERYLAGELPCALVSMDNCANNGEMLYQAINTMADGWHENNFIDDGFIKYLNDEKKVTFPWTMIDKITPRPDSQITSILKKDGFKNVTPIVTDRGSYIAPFVNAEETEYLVVEDKFPNGRPKLEQAGVIFSDRETVRKAEKMKVSTCLNPIHTALAIFGSLLSYDKISDTINDDDILNLINIIAYDEGLKAVDDPKIIDPKDFLDEVINERLPNPYIPDTPQRIMTDTSQKISARFIETIKTYENNKDLDVNSLVGIPVVISGWLRYLVGFNDEGMAMEISPDPLLKQLQNSLKKVNFGETRDFSDDISDILTNKKIFSINLYESNLAEKINYYFMEMNSGPGAVRKVLKGLKGTN